MTDENLTIGKIFIGAPIEHESERHFLIALADLLTRIGYPYVLLANFHIAGRQIDCVIALPSRVLVVEVKSSYLPIRGDLNGVWTRYDASGKWHAYTNAYQQALAAKNAVRDSMKAIRGVGTFYPDGYVVFTSGFAEDSQVTSGDFKVAIGSLDQFLSGFVYEGSVPWSLDDWQSFAAKHSLTRVSLEEAVASPQTQRSMEILRQYSAAFLAEHKRDADRWLSESSTVQADLRKAAAGTGCFISGASGCGKTLMAKWLATHLVGEGNPTFFFAAKDFSGSWSEAIRREIGLLTGQDPSIILRAFSKADKPVFLVLDGLNELGAYRHRALRGIRALAKRLGARLVVTAQEEKPPEFDGLNVFAVAEPSLALKSRIAQSRGTDLGGAALEVLKAVRSGFEAEIIGQVGSSVRTTTSRVFLLDQYMRIRLGEGARAASFGLRRFANLLHEQVAFSMSEPDFDDFMRAHDVSFTACDDMVGAGLIVRRAGRISFSHEMLQNACAAIDLARQATGDASSFGLSLSMPLFEGIAGDVVSAIDDAAICRAVLMEVRDVGLLASAANGGLGDIARSVARELLDHAADACAAEIQGAQLELRKDENSMRVQWVEDTLRNWTAPEEARLRTIGSRAVSGHDVDTYLGLCAKMDERLADERRRLAQAAKAESFPLRSQSFALVYFGFGPHIGFAKVARAGHPGWREMPDMVAKRNFHLAEMSAGQLHFFLENRRLFLKDDDEGKFADELAYLLRETFRWEPYHVQLAILHATCFARNAPADKLQKLVEAINSLDVAPANWVINSSVIDALKLLGALDDEAESNREQVKRELASVLGDDDHAVDKDFALSVCLRMFDHPFDTIYGEEIYGLEEQLRQRLFRRALGASRIKDCTSLAWLCGKVASFATVSDVPLFEPMAVLPDIANPFAQEEWGGFVLAIRFLARCGAKLPQVQEETPAASCLAKLRVLVYAAESGRSVDMKTARAAWVALHKMPPQLVIGCLSEIHSALTERHYWEEKEEHYRALNIIEVFVEDCLRVARAFVGEGREAQYFHRVPHREKGPFLAFSIIGRYGDRSDLTLLRRFSRAHPFARDALTAIRSLDFVARESH